MTDMPPNMVTHDVVWYDALAMRIGPEGFGRMQHGRRVRLFQPIGWLIGQSTDQSVRVNWLL